MGNLFVLSGPSGVGKNAVERRLKKLMPELKRVLTTTTREPRKNEEQGIHYNFVTKKHFQDMIDQGDFLEWAVVHDHMYGSPKSAVEKALKEGKQLLMIIDVQGAINVKQSLPEAHLIFLEPESIDQIESRLRRRPDMVESDLKLRLQTAKKELAMRDFYDYSIVNKDGQLKTTAKEVAAIIGKIMSKEA